MTHGEAQAFQQLEQQRKDIQIKTQDIQQERNSLSKQIGILKAKGEDTEKIMQQVASISTRTKDYEIHRDNKPFLEFFTAESIKRENWHINLTQLLKFRSNPASIIKNVPDQELMNRYLIGQNYFLNALICKNKGNLECLVDFFVSGAMGHQVWKNDAAKIRLEQWFDRFRNRIPYPVESMEVPTRYGPSHLLTGGSTLTMPSAKWKT